MATNRRIFPGLGIAGAMIVALISAGSAAAYPTYRNDASPGTDDCFQCHGDFRASPYTSPKGESWGDDLHDVHRSTMLGTDANRCNICHSAGSRVPVYLNQSVGTTGFDPVSCIGCHGRQADRGARPTDCADAAATSGPCGDGAGLRQHHWRAGETVCGDCHGDANPVGFVPVGENVKPPYYFTPDVLHPTKPTDPCNPPPFFTGENYKGSTLGLDGDGDSIYDAADSDCAAPTPTPTATANATQTPLATPTRSASPTATRTATSTATRTASPTPTRTATPTTTPSVGPTATRTASPTATRTASPTTTPSVVQTPAASATNTLGPTPTSSAFQTAVPTATAAATTGPTTTATLSPIATATPAATPTALPTPNADSQKCRAAIAKSAAAFTRAKTKALQKCASAVLKRKLPGPCPDPNAADVIRRAGDKLTAGIARACGGKNKTCDADEDDVPVAGLGWPNVCPDLEGKGCANAIDDCRGIGTCVACIGEAAVDQAFDLYYGALQPTDPSSRDKREKRLNKCQAAIGKAGAAFLAAQSKTLQKCWEAANRGEVAACPDANVEEAIGDAAQKLAATIDASCAGKDKQPGGDGENADFTPTEIGFPPTCTDVTFPGFATPCAGAVTDLQSLSSCVACVTRFEAGCADRAGAIGIALEYPPQCNP